MNVVLTPRRRVLAYATGSFGLAMNGMIQFLLPLRATELGINIGLIGLMLGAKALTESVVSLPVGSLMDRIGARKAFILGTGACALIGVGFLFATGVMGLLVLQVMLGVARPLGWVGGQSYVAGLRTGAERAHDTGRFSFAANVAQIAAPLLVGVASQAFSVRLSFGVMAAYSAAFVLLGLALPDAGRHEGAKQKDQGTFANALGLLRIPGIRVAMLLTFARLFIPATWTSFLPLYLVTSGMPAGVAGSVISVMGLTATIVNLFSGRIARLGSAEMVTAAGLAISAVGVAAAPFLVGVPYAHLGAVLVGIGQGISLPMLIVIVSNAALPEQRGLALGLRSSVNQVASAIAPVSIAPIIGVAGVVVGFPVAGGIVAAALLAAVVLHGRRAAEPTEAKPPE